MAFTCSVRRKQIVRLRQFCLRVRVGKACACVSIRLWPSGLENFIVSVIVSDVLKEPVASFSTYAMKMTAVYASERLVIPYQTTGCHRAGDHNLCA
jgi:hypothetical protein